MKLLIDGDLYAYRCAASAENKDAATACEYMDKLLDQCILETGGTEFQFFLTGDTNFRYKIYPEYKATRINVEKPRFLKDCQQYLTTQYNAITSEGCEADDYLGMNQREDTIIVSLDKDLLMIPGQHYSWHIEGGTPEKRWVREARYQVVGKEEGLRRFYTQLLTGDSSDNIKGVSGIGPKKAEQLLYPCTSERMMFDAVRDAYGCDEEMLMNGQCLWIWQKENDIWKFPFNEEVQ